MCVLVQETADMVTPAPDLTDPSAQAETTEVTQPTEPRTVRLSQLVFFFLSAFLACALSFLSFFLSLMHFYVKLADVAQYLAF